MKLKPVRLEPEALAELEAAAVFYDGREPGLGSALLLEVSQVLDLVRQGPARYAPAPGVPWELGVKRALLRQFPYTVAFVELPAEIRVLAVAHGKQRPGYWRRRL